MEDILRILDENEKKNKEKHIFITDELYSYGKFLLEHGELENGNEELLEKARDISYWLENSYWERDDMIDIEYNKLDRYWALFAEYWFTRRFFEKLLENSNSCEEALSLLESIKESELKLWGLALHEKKARELMYSSPGEAILILQSARGFHSQIYIDIFNYFLDTNQFNNYRPFRELELLSKDFDEDDIREDLENNNLSAAVILYENMKKGYINLEEAVVLIENVGDTILQEINEKENYFYKKGRKLLEELPTKAKKSLCRLSFS